MFSICGKCSCSALVVFGGVADYLDHMSWHHSPQGEIHLNEDLDVFEITREAVTVRKMIVPDRTWGHWCVPALPVMSVLLIQLLYSVVSQLGVAHACKRL